MIMEPSGNSLPSVTSEPAPTKQFFPIFGAIQHHRTNANERLVTNGATMQHHLVPHGDMLSDGQWLAMVCMEHAAILNVTAFANVNGFGVASNHSPKPNAGVVGQHHIAHDLGTVGHPSAFGHDGSLVI
jgi:hypothetical protein